MKSAALLISCTVFCSLPSIAPGRGRPGVLPPTPSGVAAFQVPLPILPTLAPNYSDATHDYYKMEAAVGQKEIIPGKLTTIWGFNGIFPGPTIRAQRGRTVVITQVNHLQESTSVHLHGGHTPSDSDGLPYDLIGPGASKIYTYPNNQPSATLWYHDHAIDTTGRHVWMGLAGFYIIDDPPTAPVGLPSGASDVALILQDRLFNKDGSLNYPLTDSTITTGVYGDTLLVNGAIQPYFQVARRKMRFRILNASNTRIYQLALSSGDPLVQIASDGGLLAAPATRKSISVAPGERIEVVIDFANYALGTSLILKNLDEPPDNVVIPDVMRFDVVRDEIDHSFVPSTLASVPRIPEKSASVSRDFVLVAEKRHGRLVWTINGNLYDPARIDAAPHLNDTEIWTFLNDSSESHPMHIHDIQFQILDINGVPPEPGDDGWKDTVLVPDLGGTVRVIAKFTDYLGPFVSHCHKLEHEDHAMMFNFSVQP